MNELPPRIDRALQGRFATEFGEGAEATVRAPGRVNLIGDHTDYNGLPVLPMALQRCVGVRFRPRPDGGVRLVHVDSSFAPVAFDLTPSPPPGPPGDWGNYARAAASGLFEDHTDWVGIDAVVAGNIPVASGLSSSSALVVAVAVALLVANDVEVDRLALAAKMARAERYVGTHGGGMDQTVCLAAVRGAALRIDFEPPPVRVTPIPIPAGWRFVVIDSGIRAEKAAGARVTYNRRTDECAEALAQVTALLGRSTDAPSYASLVSQSDPEGLESVAARLPDPLAARFRHVVSEAARVDAAARALGDEDAAAFGHLMNASHQSLRDDFGVSLPALDALVDAARSRGALGARVTGAGMGGSIVALCETETVARRVRDGVPEGAAFIAQPGAGAGVVT